MNIRTEKVKYLFDKPEGYLKKNFDISIRTLIAHELLGNIKNSRILDIGCGDGSISLQFSSSTNRLVLVDLSKKMLYAAKKNTPEKYKEKVEFINSDLFSYKSDELFDVVFCIGVLAHVHSIDETITKISRLLKPGGRCVLQTTDNDKLTGKFMNTYYSIKNSFSPSIKYSLNKIGQSHIMSLAQSNGLKLVGIRRYLSPFLGLGKMPNEWLFKYEHYTLTHDFLSKFGSETHSLFIKEE